jgi:hypothetical protein
VPVLALALTALVAAAPADVAGCKQALGKVKSHDGAERIDALQACGPLLGDARIRAAWFDAVHTSVYDTAPMLALAANEPIPGDAGAKNACARTGADLDICKAPRAEVLKLKPQERALQWKKLFMRLLAVDLPAAQADALQDAFERKWPLLFPEPMPPALAITSELKISGNINRLELLRALGTVKPELLKCLESPTAELGLSFTVEAGGKLGRFAVLHPDDKARVACITRAFKAAVLPPPLDHGAAIIVWTPNEVPED